MRVYMYIMAASTDPDVVERSVPFAIDETEVFFGPCKKNLRREMRERYLRPNADLAVPSEEVYLVGLNGGNRKRVRKIIWAGRTKKVMTFDRAHDELREGRYQFMRTRSATPMHLRPIREDGRLVGYEHVGSLHGADWILDLAGRRRSTKYEVTESRVRISNGFSARQAFTRDACMLLENTFSAVGAGLEMGEEILALLRKAQSDVPPESIDAYAVFGRQPNGDVRGRRGQWLAFGGDLASQLIDAIKVRAEALKPRQRPVAELPSNDACCCDPEDREEEEEDEDGAC